MTIIPIIILAAFVVASIFILNQGPKDKESAQREKFWSKQEGK